MGLIVRPPSWGHCTTNLTGTPSTTVFGTAITAGANNADAASVSFIANITHDVEYLVIASNAIQTAGANTSALLDILIDPAGGSTWDAEPLINDLMMGQGLPASVTVPLTYYYYFPIWLKSGHSIGGRMRTAHTADVTTGEVVVFAYGGNAHPSSWWCGQTVESIGINAAASQGQDHTAGNSGAYSTWANLGSALSKPCGALQFAVQGTNDDTNQANASYFFEFGVGSTRIGPNILRTASTSEAGWTIPTGPIFCALPASTQLQVRGTCSGTAEVLDVAAYAVM
jgi:hypothetical protein